MYKLLIKRIIYPITVKCKGKKSGRSILNRQYYNFYKDNEFNDYNKNLEMQKTLLFNIVDYAVNNIKYYKDIASDLNFKYTHDNITDDIRKLPILDKALIRNNSENLIKITNTKAFINTSGGSTGEPVKFMQDQNYHKKLNILYNDSLAGYEVGDKVVEIWAQRDSVSKKGKGLSEYMIRSIKRLKTIDSLYFTEENIKNAVKLINRYKPKIIISYIQSINQLSKYIEENNIQIYSPDAIIATAGTIYPNFRKKIEKVFNTEVFNRYGSREVGCIAMECEKHDGLHLNPFNHFIEILDNEGREVQEGEIGEIYITQLTNYTMPLIRYKIGDMARKSSRLCKCGRTYQIVSEIMGRYVSMFKKANGDLIDGNIFIRRFYFTSFIEKFQVIQEDYHNITVKLQLKDKSFYIKEKQFFKRIAGEIEDIMDNDCVVKFKLLDNIPATNSGKYLYIVSKI